jgi:glycolate oxidase iron-sulfur subunit
MPWLKLFIGSPAGLNWLRRLSHWSQIPVARNLMKRLTPQFAAPALSLMDGLPAYTPGPLSRYRLTSDIGTDGVFLFVGCVMDSVYAQTNVHSAALLRLAGQRVFIPDEQRCCGALHLHAGRPDDARRWARRNIEAFEHIKARAIVVNAAGCGTTLKEYPQLFAQNSPWHERAVRFSNAVQDILVVLQNHPLPALPPRSERITIHDACHHVHAQQIFEAPRELLSRAGYLIEEMADSSRCCGSAGVYNLTHADMSQALLQNKLHNIPDDIDTVAAANPGCILQIQSGAVQSGRHQLRVRHPIDLAYDAYQANGYWASGGQHAGEMA